MGRLEGECELTRLTDRFIEAAAGLRDRLLCPYILQHHPILQHHSRCEFTGEKTPGLNYSRTYAAEMNQG